VKDLNVMEFDESVKQDTPLGLLRGIKFGTETYHTLFMRLCRYLVASVYVGLHRSLKAKLYGSSFLVASLQRRC